MAELNLDLARKAAYRRVLAVLRSERLPFILVGAFAETMHLGEAVDGELELFVTEEAAEPTLTALAAAGFKVVEHEGGGGTVVGHGGHTVSIAWKLPPPLGGPVDESWLDNATRRSFLDLRIRVAALEELVWMRLAAASDLAVDGVLDALLGRIEADFDWTRLVSRMSGLEALLLAHLFLFFHRHPEKARETIPATVVQALISRMSSNASLSPVQPAAH